MLSIKDVTTNHKQFRKADMLEESQDEPLAENSNDMDFIRSLLRNNDHESLDKDYTTMFPTHTQTLQDQKGSCSMTLDQEKPEEDGGRQHQKYFKKPATKINQPHSFARAEPFLKARKRKFGAKFDFSLPEYELNKGLSFQHNLFKDKDEIERKDNRISRNHSGQLLSEQNSQDQIDRIKSKRIVNLFQLGLSGDFQDRRESVMQMSSDFAGLESSSSESSDEDQDNIIIEDDGPKRQRYDDEFEMVDRTDAKIFENLKERISKMFHEAPVLKRKQSFFQSGFKNARMMLANKVSSARSSITRKLDNSLPFQQNSTPQSILKQGPDYRPTDLSKQEQQKSVKIVESQNQYEDAENHLHPTPEEQQTETKQLNKNYDSTKNLLEKNQDENSNTANAERPVEHQQQSGETPDEKTQPVDSDKKQLKLKKCDYKIQCKVINPFKDLKQEWSKDYHPINASTGWHLPNQNLRTSDLGDLGIGICNYFKLVKFYMIFFLIFSLLSLPAFIFYASGNKSDLKEVTLQTALSTLALGNIGQAQTSCNYDMYNENQKEAQVQMFCSYGDFSTVKVYGIGIQSSTCNDKEKGGIKLDQNCNSDSMPISYINKIDKKFAQQCKDKSFCNITISLDDFSPSCQSKLRSNTSQLIFFQALCQQEYITMPSINLKISRSDLGVTVIVLDILIVIILLLSIPLLKRYENIADLELNGVQVITQDYSVIIDNLPPLSEFQSKTELKMSLWLHLEEQLRQNKVIRAGDQVYQHQEEFEIFDIYLAETGYENLNTMFSMYDQIKKLQELEFQISVEKFKAKAKNNDAKLRRLEFQNEGRMEILQGKVMEFKEMNSRPSDIKCAFVIFRKIEKRNQIQALYDKSWIKQFFFTRIYKVKKFTSKLFHKKWLNVKNSISPDIIAWENINTIDQGQLLRKIAVFLKIALMQSSTFIVLIAGKYYDAEMKRFSPIIECPKDFVISKESAFEDQLKDQGERVGLMNCYCYGQFQSLSFAALNIKFQDGHKYCSTWFALYTVHNGIIYVQAFIISIINLIIFKIITCKPNILLNLLDLSKFEISAIKESQLVARTKKMFYISFFNTGIIIFLVNVNLGQPPIDFFPIFAGDYQEFTVEWYKVVGSTIVFSLIVNAILPHLYNAFGFIVAQSFQCTILKGQIVNNVKVFKKQTIDNQGSLFVFEYRYSQFLTMIFIVMMYSPGLPIMYMIALVALFCQYWFDKIFLLKFYEKPPRIDMNLGNSTRSLIKYSVIFHFLIGLFMYSNSSILTPSALSLGEISSVEFQGNQYFNSRRYSSIHLIIFIIFICLLILAKGIILPLFLKKSTKFYNWWEALKKRFYVKKYSESDYIDELNIQQLINEYQKTQREIDICGIQFQEMISPLNTEGPLQMIPENEEKENSDQALYQEILRKKLMILGSKIDQIIDKRSVRKCSTAQAIEMIKDKINEGTVENKLKNKIYSYDPLDNVHYKQFLLLSQQFKDEVN